jgi:hypothetical protein
MLYLPHEDVVSLHFNFKMFTNKELFIKSTPIQLFKKNRQMVNVGASVKRIMLYAEFWL